MKLRRAEVIFMLACILIAVVFVLAACAEPNVLTSGKVIDKNYDDADTWYVPGYTIDGGQTCSGGYSNGNYGYTPRVCTDNPDTYVPGYMDYDPEHWALRIEGPLRDGKPPIREWHQVSEREYERHHVGDRWEE